MNPYPTPSPFRFAQVPASYLGFSAEPQFPAIPDNTDRDLDKLRLAYAQAGAGPDVLARIDEVRARRRGQAVDLQMMLLGRAGEQANAPLGRVQQFGQAAGAAYGSLNSALRQQ